MSGGGSLQHPALPQGWTAIAWASVPAGFLVACLQQQTQATNPCSIERGSFIASSLPLVLLVSSQMTRGKNWVGDVEISVPPCLKINWNGIHSPLTHMQLRPPLTTLPVKLFFPSESLSPSAFHVSSLGCPVPSDL